MNQIKNFSPLEGPCGSERAPPSIGGEEEDPSTLCHAPLCVCREDLDAHDAEGEGQDEQSYKELRAGGARANSVVNMTQP